jgi:hypothetical protein
MGTETGTAPAITGGHVSSISAEAAATIGKAVVDHVASTSKDRPEQTKGQKIRELSEELTTEQIERIAYICHETNRAYCKSLGDNSQVKWADAPAWQKQSAIAGVIKHLNGHLNAESSHNSWMEQKLRDGWTYGPTKDADKKQHPSLLPYDSLSLEEKLKDHLFGAIVRQFRDYHRYTRSRGLIGYAGAESGDCAQETSASF